MNFKLHLTVATVLCLNLVQHVVHAANALPSEALIECGRVYHIDNIVNVSTATASYSNSGCKLICVVGSAILPVDSIHEGQSCPDDFVGICRAGACIGGQEEAIHECGLIHGMDFHSVPNHEGTVFLNDQCSVRCVLGGVQLSPSYRHEGSPCPTNAVGVCYGGHCVVQNANPGPTAFPKVAQPTLPPPTVGPTLPPPTVAPTIPSPTVTQPSNNYPFSPWMMKLVNITLVSANPPLKLEQKIILNFSSHSDPFTSTKICTLYGNSSMRNEYELLRLTDLPSKLTQTSILDIDFYSNGYLSEHHENLYGLFVHFYHSRKSNYGEEEQFVAQFRIVSLTSPYVKLVDVSLGFTIVFDN